MFWFVNGLPLTFPGECIPPLVTYSRIDGIIYIYKIGLAANHHF